MANSLQPNIRAGATSIRLPILLSSSSTFTELTGIVFGNVTASYVREGAARVAITPITLASAVAAYASGGWFEYDATNCPGLYRFDIPDAAFAAGAEWVVIVVKVAGSLVFYEQFNLATATTTDVKTDTAAIKVKTDALPATFSDATAANQTTILANLATKAATGAAMTLTSGERDAVAAALLVSVLEGAVTVEEALRAALAHAAGDLVKSGSNLILKSLDGSKDRATATITDATGERAVTGRDLS